MADFEDWDTDGGGDQAGGASRGTPQIQGGLLDPRTFPSPWPSADALSIDAQAPAIKGPLDTDVHDEVLQDILAAQAKLPSAADDLSLDRPAPQINGPLMTDAHAEVLQDILNAQAKLPPVPAHPETWSVNGQPYLAISANTFDPARSTGVTSMPTPEESAAAFAGRKQFAVPYGDAESVGYIAGSPSKAVPVMGQARATNAATTSTYKAPAGSPRIHGHIDGGLYASEGMVDNTEEAKGYGDTASFNASPPVPTATVSQGQVGRHVLDNGQLKFLYPPGSMASSQIGDMQRKLDYEQQKFLRPK